MKPNTKEIEKIASELGFTTTLIIDWGDGFQRGMFKYNGTNEKEEQLTVELTYCCQEGKNSLPAIWYRNGDTPKLMPEFWGFHTYVRDKYNNGYMAYDPTVKMDDYKQRLVINFGWHFEPTAENAEKLLKETVKRFNLAEKWVL